MKNWIILSENWFWWQSLLPSIESTVADWSHSLWLGPAFRWIKHWIIPVSVKRNERILMIVSDIFLIRWSICMAFIFLNHLTATMRPEPNEPKDVRLQLRITSSPKLGVDVEADKVAVNEAIGPKTRDKTQESDKMWVIVTQY